MPTHLRSAQRLLFLLGTLCLCGCAGGPERELASLLDVPPLPHVLGLTLELGEGAIYGDADTWRSALLDAFEAGGVSAAVDP